MRFVMRDEARIIVQLKDFGIRGKEVYVAKDHFRDGYAVLRFRGDQAEKILTIDSSRCGLCYRSLLENAVAGRMVLVAYADDGLLLLAADSRRGLKDRAKVACDNALKRNKENRLGLSDRKTKIIESKVSRTLTDTMGDYEIGHVIKYKYLGVILDYKITFKTHLDYIGRKAVDTFYNVGRLSRANSEFGFK